MDSKTEIAKELGRLSPPGAPASPVEIAVGPGRLRVDVQESCPIGCSVGSVSWESPELSRAGAPLDACRKLERDVRYLLEPLAIQEHDREEGVVQMRSASPSTDESGGRSYYELEARPDGLTLRRWTKPAGEPRAETPIELTREALARLGGDLAKSTQSSP